MLLEALAARINWVYMDLLEALFKCVGCIGDKLTAKSTHSNLGRFWNILIDSFKDLLLKHRKLSGYAIAVAVQRLRPSQSRKG